MNKIKRGRTRWISETSSSITSSTQSIRNRRTCSSCFSASLHDFWPSLIKSSNDRPVTGGVNSRPDSVRNLRESFWIRWNQTRITNKSKRTYSPSIYISVSLGFTLLCYYLCSLPSSFPSLSVSLSIFLIQSDDVRFYLSRVTYSGAVEEG